MTAEGGAGVVIDVVADETDGPIETQRFNGFLQEKVAGAVVADHVDGGGAFRGAIFQVAHVNIDTPTIEEKSAIAGRFVPVAVMEIDQAVTVVLEKPVAYAREDILELRWRLNQAPIFRFQARNALRHFSRITFQHRIGSRGRPPHRRMIGRGGGGTPPSRRYFLFMF